MDGASMEHRRHARSLPAQVLIISHITLATKIIFSGVISFARGRQSSVWYPDAIRGIEYLGYLNHPA